MVESKINNLVKSENRRSAERILVKTVSIYLIIYSLWLVVSFIVLDILSSVKNGGLCVSTIKGLEYIVLTGLLFVVLLYSTLKRLNHTYNKQFKEYEQKLHNFEYHDNLTGLHNRLELIERLNDLVQQKNDRMCALIFIDVDNFRYLNDTMGHTVGDLLLRKISERILKFHKINYIFYRLGVDEFGVLIEGIKDSIEIKELASEILKEFKSGFKLENSWLFITLSMGISVYPNNGCTADDFMKNANIALYKAKESGGNKIVFYNEKLNEAVMERMDIEKNLCTALDNNEFELYYQPQLDISTNKIAGFEALIRWKNSQLGFVSPNRFIGIAEDTNLIVPIGEWVLRNACLFLKTLQQNNYNDLNISVNVSIIQLLQENFVDIVLEVIDTMKINPKQLELEITESILMESYKIIKDKLNFLRDRGIKIALDDFGKGYSSLNHLKQLPITTLKIDKSFINTISNDDNNKSLINIIVDIGKNMDLCVIAEGVETQEQMDYLAECKCNKIQGYLFSKPMPEHEAYKKIREQG